MGGSGWSARTNMYSLSVMTCAALVVAFLGLISCRDEDFPWSSNYTSSSSRVDQQPVEGQVFDGEQQTMIRHGRSRSRFSRIVREKKAGKDKLQPLPPIESDFKYDGIILFLLSLGSSIYVMIIL